MSKEELANLEIERAIRALKPENRQNQGVAPDGVSVAMAKSDIREDMSVGGYGLSDVGDDDTFRTGGRRRTRRTQRRPRRSGKRGRAAATRGRRSRRILKRKRS